MPRLLTPSRPGERKGLPDAATRSPAPASKTATDINLQKSISIEVNRTHRDISRETGRLSSYNKARKSLPEDDYEDEECLAGRKRK